MVDRPVELVVFDLGHVLIDVARSWMHAAELAGVRPNGPITPEMVGRIWEVVCESEVGAIGQREFAERVGTIVGLPADDIDRLSHAFLREPYPGVPELLGELAATGARVACLSNTNALHWSKMTDPADPSHLPLQGLDFAWASHLLAARKPEAAIYERAQDEAGVHGEAILFFDNLGENVEAARACGWRAELVEMDGDPVPQLRRHLAGYGVLTAGGC